MADAAANPPSSSSPAAPPAAAPAAPPPDPLPADPLLGAIVALGAESLPLTQDSIPAFRVERDAWPLVARAQPTPRRPVVAFVDAVIPPAEMAGSNPISPLARAFVHGLHDLGWIEGQTVVIERRSAEGDPQRAPAIFAELITRGVDVIAMGGSRWLRETAQQATKTIPTVLLFDADPVAEGVVPSLARPGGNLTGVIGTLETLVGHRRLRAGRSASAFYSIWRRTGSSMGERCSGGCAGKVPPSI